MNYPNPWEPFMSGDGWRDDPPSRQVEAAQRVDSWTDEQWDAYIDNVATGLSWATSESMSDANDAEVLAVTRELVRRARR